MISCYKSHLWGLSSEKLIDYKQRVGATLQKEDAIFGELEKFSTENITHAEKATTEERSTIKENCAKLMKLLREPTTENAVHKELIDAYALSLRYLSNDTVNSSLKCNIFQ